MGNKVVIIGGGISGLVSGVFAQINGYKSKIYEKNNDVGGLLLKNNFKKDYLNDNFTYFYFCDELKKIYDLIGLENLKLVETEFLIQYKDIFFYKDVKKLEEELIKKYILDEKRIKKFIEILVEAKQMCLFYEKPIDCLSLVEPIRYKSKMKVNDKIYKKYHSISIEKYFSDFESKDIAKMMYAMMPKKTSMYKLIFLLGMYLSNRFDKVNMNSFEIISCIKNKYLSLGGEIVNNKTALSIDVEKGKAIGVWFDNKYYVNADYIISAIDTKHLYYDLLNNKYKDQKLDIKYMDFNTYPTYSALNFNFLIKDSNLIPYVFSDDISRFKIGSQSIDLLTFINRGNGFVSCSILQGNEEYIYWSLYNKNPSAYKKELNRISEHIRLELETILKNRFNHSSSVKIIDYSSPLDFEGKFNCFRGNIYGFGLNAKGAIIKHDGRIRDLKNIYIASQWVSEHGGIIGAISSGYYSIIRLNYDNK